jgi:DGQHR domain-containing protein
MSRPRELRIPALELRQGRHRLYQFGVDGKRLASFTTVSRVRRDDDNQIDGYQRPETVAHIRSIRRYLEGADPLMPNALVVAFDARVSFEPAGDAPRTPGSRVGTLVIPLDTDADDRPGWIVDGQQRSAAVRDAAIKRFPVPVVAFVTDDVAEQRAQFILVNSTKPLPKGLIHELLPSTEANLPAPLLRKRYPATLLEALNYTDPCARWPEGSPLAGLIRTPTTPDGVIKDNSILKMVENSITDGALYRYYDPETGRGQTDLMLDVLFNFWRAVREVFPDGWGEPPRRSRLMHGVGIVSLGFVMDAITDRRTADGLPPSQETYANDLRPLVDICAWTRGSWDFGLRDHRQWNDLQNIPRDINMLTDYLLREYRVRTADDEDQPALQAAG